MAEENMMPLFYKDPVILNARDHSDLTLTGSRNFAFAKTCNSVPVVLSEIPYLIPYYPVIFTTGPNPVLVAVLGVRNNENLFVDAEGNWRADAYIPAYVRRYPFIMTEVNQGDGRHTEVLGCEMDPAFISHGGEQGKLFEAGKPTQISANVYRFCMGFQKDWEATRTFCAEVLKAGVLEEKACKLNTPSGKTFNLTGFSAVNEEKLDALDNHTINAWRKQHVLKHLYYHLASMERIGFFVPMLEKALAGETPTAPAYTEAAAMETPSAGAAQ